MKAHKETPELIKILEFLKDIQINVIEKELDDSTFLPGLAIGTNCLEIDFDKLLYPGDILHEVGHLAVTTSEDRNRIGTDAMAKDWPSQGDEIVAMLWSYAASHHLELPIEYVFHPNGYKDASPWLIENFNSENYVGLPLLEWMGLTMSKEKALKEGKKPFPNMIKWIRD